MSFRIEEKLLVDPNRLGDLYGWISSSSGYTLHPLRLIYSTYFDTNDMTMFFDSEEGNLPRKKIRVRSYGGTDHLKADCSLEIKTSSIEGRFKSAQNIEERKKNSLLNAGVFDEQYGMCPPAVCVAYFREYFAVSGVRLTIDQDIRYRSADSRFWIEDAAIAVEVKAPDSYSFDFLDQNFPFRRVRFSKYARAVRAVKNDCDAWI